MRLFPATLQTKLSRMAFDHAPTAALHSAIHVATRINPLVFPKKTPAKTGTFGRIIQSLFRVQPQQGALRPALGASALASAAFMSGCCPDGEVDGRLVYQLGLLALGAMLGYGAIITRKG